MSTEERALEGCRPGQRMERSPKPAQFTKDRKQGRSPCRSSRSVPRGPFQLGAYVQAPAISVSASQETEGLGSEDYILGPIGQAEG